MVLPTLAYSLIFSGLPYPTFSIGTSDQDISAKDFLTIVIAIIAYLSAVRLFYYSRLSTSRSAKTNLLFLMPADINLLICGVFTIGHICVRDMGVQFAWFEHVKYPAFVFLYSIAYLAILHVLAWKDTVGANLRSPNTATLKQGTVHVQIRVPAQTIQGKGIHIDVSSENAEIRVDP